MFTIFHGIDEGRDTNIMVSTVLIFLSVYSIVLLCLNMFTYVVVETTREVNPIE